MHKHKINLIIFYSGALINIAAALLVSRGFTHNGLGEQFPALFSFYGLIGIMLWGAAYAASAQFYRHARALVGVFVVEKLVYVISWISYIYNHGSEIAPLLASDFLTGAFLAIYGVNDLIYMLLFIFIFLQKPDFESET